MLVLFRLWTMETFIFLITPAAAFACSHCSLFVLHHAQDFEARVDHYRTEYETVTMSEGSFVKIHDAGQRLEIHAAQG